jgi:hypothetical protein
MPLTALENELRTLARDRIRDGRLPCTAPLRMWGGQGSEAPCSLCDNRIAKQEIEYEVESFIGEGPQIHRFHFLCHAAWQLECARYEHLCRSGQPP